MWCLYFRMDLGNATAMNQNSTGYIIIKLLPRYIKQKLYDQYVWFDFEILI